VCVCVCVCVCVYSAQFEHVLHPIFEKVCVSLFLSPPLSLPPSLFLSPSRTGLTGVRQMSRKCGRVRSP